MQNPSKNTNKKIQQALLELMIYVVFSDIHDMHERLDYLPRSRDFAYLCLGDIVQGQPKGAMRAIDRLRELDAKTVYGNHDRKVFDDRYHRKLLDLERDSIENGTGKENMFRKFYDDGVRLREGLPYEYIEFLASLPRTAEASYNGMGITFVHDTLNVDKKIRERSKRRIANEEIARANFESSEFKGNILAVAHTHVPFILVQGEKIADTLINDNYKGTIEERRLILNPGALQSLAERQSYLGLSSACTQTKPSYAVIDTEKRTFEVRFF